MLTAFLPASQAAIIASEYFDYAVDTTIAGKNTGTGWANAWSTGANGTALLWGTTLSAGAPIGYNLSVTSPALQLVPISGASGATKDAWRTISNGIALKPATDTTIYFSYLWARTDTSATGTSYEMSTFSLRDNAGKQLVNFGVNGNELPIIQLQPDAIGTTALSVSGTQTLKVTGDLATTGKYLFVGKMELNSDGSSSFYLSVFDSSNTLTGEPLEWDVIATATLMDTTFKRLTVAGQKDGGTTYWDNIVFGDTFSDVTGYIPEPAMASSLIGVAALALVWSQRRRAYARGQR